jgi:DNA invertase Pin-like site-specific DNA recombinase
MGKLICYNEDGRRCGETHHRAKLTDEQVNAARDLHEDLGLSYAQIASLLGVSKSAVACICQYKKRANLVVEWRALKRVEK